MAAATFNKLSPMRSRRNSPQTPTKAGKERSLTHSLTRSLSLCGATHEVRNSTRAARSLPHTSCHSVCDKRQPFGSANSDCRRRRGSWLVARAVASSSAQISQLGNVAMFVLRRDFVAALTATAAAKATAAAAFWPTTTVGSKCNCQ